MRILTLAFILAATGALASAESHPDGTTYYVGHEEKFVNITFESNADVETIVGTTHEATGKMTVDLDQGTGSVSITVPVKSLRTGIDARDEHLRQPQWLDAEKFPSISFTSKTSALAPGKKDQVLVTGDFSVHGQKKEISIPVSFKTIPQAATEKAGFGEGQWVKFSTEFEVKLPDYGVKVPEGIVAKVSDTWKVKIAIFASTKKAG